jgi:hypothetical protein
MEAVLVRFSIVNLAASRSTVTRMGFRRIRPSEFGGLSGPHALGPSGWLGRARK